MIMHQDGWLSWVLGLLKAPSVLIISIVDKDNVQCWMGWRMDDKIDGKDYDNDNFDSCDNVGWQCRVLDGWADVWWTVGGGHPLGDNLHWKSFPNTPIFCWEGKSAKSLTFVWQSPLMPFKTTNTLTNKQANDDHCVGIAFFCKRWQNRLNSLISPWRPEKFQSKGKRKVNISGCKKESRLPRYKALKLHDTSLHFLGALNFLASQKMFQSGCWSKHSRQFSRRFHSMACYAPAAMQANKR